jgi:hypothetical protein
MRVHYADINHNRCPAHFDFWIRPIFPNGMELAALWAHFSYSVVFGLVIEI